MNATPTAPFEAFLAHTGAPGHRLCIHTAPQGPVHAAVLHVHAFAEEMNKSRRMAASCARALAGQGVAVLQIDLQGCGDSDGDLADVTWDGWLRDLSWALDWLRQRHPGVPVWIWGHRAGALLASQLASSQAALGHTCHLLWWAPVLQGKAVIQQFLRLKAAAEWASGDGKAAMAQARAELAAGRSVLIAGYAISPALAEAFERASLAPPPAAVEGAPRRLVWLECSQARADEAPALSPAARLQLSAWQTAGFEVDALAVEGPAFWQTVEIEDAPALTDATVAALTRPAVAGSSTAVAGVAA